MKAAGDRQGGPTTRTLVGGAATNRAALPEQATSEAAVAADRRHTRLLPDPVPDLPGGEARAGGGDSEAREGPTGAGGALGELPLEHDPISQPNLDF
jgi:hypothetical protein